MQLHQRRPIQQQPVAQHPERPVSGDEKWWGLLFTGRELEITEVCLLAELVMGPRWEAGVFRPKV